MASPEASTRIVQLKVRLLGLSPMIWRRVLVPESVTLRELHGILQVGMGWEVPTSTISTFTPCTTVPLSLMPRARM